MTYDGYCTRCIQAAPGSAVAWWLMATYAYEELNRPIITDGLFDQIAVYIGDNWDALQHPNKKQLRRGSLKGRMGLKGKYPLRVISAAHGLMAKTEKQWMRAKR